MTEKPTPIKYTIEECGQWFPWSNLAPRSIRGVRAVMFDDGTVFDVVHGWRKQTYCPHCGSSQ